MNDTAASKARKPVAVVPSSAAYEALVERWWADHFPGSPVAVMTAAWNHAFAAKEELKRRLADAQGASLKEDN
jgi:hypothetical protein